MRTDENNKLLIPFIIAMVGAIMMIVTVFLPYATAIDEQAEAINENPDMIVYEDLNMIASDIKDISMVEYVNIYTNLGEQLFGNASFGTLYVVLLGLIVGFAVLAAIFSLIKKPVAVIVFDILAFAVFSLQNYDYTDRGVIPSSSYDWGVGYYVFYVAAVVTLVGAIWMLMTEMNMKKMNKVEDSQQLA